jgi:hypothetical protein
VGCAIDRCIELKQHESTIRSETGMVKYGPSEGSPKVSLCREALEFSVTGELEYLLERVPNLVFAGAS